MRRCLECNVEIPRRKFCSKKCSAVYRSKNACAISEATLRSEYEEERLSLLEIANRHNLSITTICKYLKKYNIESRGNHIDFSGQKIGGLRVIEPLSVGHKGGGKHIKWKCVCDCGREHVAFSHHLSRSLSVRCKICSDMARRSDLELKNYMWTAFKRNAKNRGLEFDIERDWAYNLFLEQDRRCGLTGVEIGFADCASDHKQGGTTASPDRIDSSKGYVEGNVRWVHKTINSMRSTMNDNEFVGWCRLVVENNALHSS